MRSVGRARNVRRRWSSLAFLALVVLTAATLSQCKMVDERLTGVASPFKDQPAKCMQSCQKESDQELRDEAREHTEKVLECNGDATCLALEQIRHENRIAEIGSQLQTCLNGCHHQGAGEGGR
jgi:hypothetical protein